VLDLSSIRPHALILRWFATVVVLFVLVSRAEKLVHGEVAVQGAPCRVAVVLCLLTEIFREERGETRPCGSSGVQHLLHELGVVVTAAHHRQ
jgi:hypothetical protein